MNQKLAAMTLDEFLSYVAGQAAYEKRRWPRGQVLIDAIYAARPNLSGKIRGTDMDPTSCVSWYEPQYQACLQFLRENWREDNRG